MELDTWSGITIDGGVAKERATKTPTPPPRNFDFDRTQRDSSNSNNVPETTEIDVVYPEHNFDPSKVICRRETTQRNPPPASKTSKEPSTWG